MNPPYISQENIPKNKKESYASKYGLDMKSDLYAYFFMRALNILSSKGVASVISSDKWLETDYNISLQEHIKKNLIAIYGQKNRPLGVNVNTVISLFTNEMLSDPVNFVYLESYKSNKVIRNESIDRQKLESGK